MKQYILIEECESKATKSLSYKDDCNTINDTKYCITKYILT